MEIKKIEITAFAEGSADCIHITINDRLQILLDAGKKRYYDDVYKVLKDNEKDINYIVITHKHSDHLGGLSKFIDLCLDKPEFMGLILWVPETDMTSFIINATINKLKDKKILYFNPDNICESKLFNENIRLLAPTLHQEYDTDYMNKNSIIIAFKIKDKYLIFTGDATQEEELNMIHKYNDIVRNAIIVKLGHHGSSTSSSNEYIEILSKAGIEKVMCCCRKNWDSKPPDREKIDYIEEKLGKEKMLYTGKNGNSQNINIICEINNSGEIVIK